MAGLSEQNMKELVNKAIEARGFSYSPYSHFQVGAALLCRDGTVYQGCNVENAAYGATNCAEKTAFCKAVSEGKREFSAIAIVGGKEKGGITSYSYPCGSCRQVMAEFCSEDFVVIVGKAEEEYLIYRLDELLPFHFGPDDVF